MNNLEVDLTPAQNKIIKYLCKLQIESLMRLHEGEQRCETDVILWLCQNEISQTDFKKSLLESINIIENVKDNPDDLRKLNPSDLSMFRHFLANIEEEYKNRYPKAIANLWGRFFLIEAADGNLNMAQFN